MKLGKILGISLGILGGAYLVAAVSNEIRYEKMQKEFWEEYSKNYKPKIDVDTIHSTAQKAYFEASQLINDSIKTTKKVIK